MSFLAQSVIFLAAAVVAVPIAKRLGLGSVLGYLAAGTVIGPWALGLIADVESILHFAEFGVVLLLFIIGLELQPARLWTMRKTVFGLGGAQVLITGAVLGAMGLLFGLSLQTAAIAGFALALSSTAFALQTLAEKNQLTTRHGRTAFSILLFQDLAVIPMIALVPLVGGQAEGATPGDIVVALLKVAGVLVAVVIGGHYLLHYLFRVIARTRLREAFTAMTLLTVVGTALLVEQVGLSMALGAFLAGMLLADSEFRHELEANIEPFKGLLLGLFFISVGMSVNFGLVAEQPVMIVGLALGLVAIKGVVLFALAKSAGQATATAMQLAVAISQGGEFAFVIFGVALGSRIMEPQLADLLIVVVILSMVVTPLLFALSGRLLGKRRPGAEDSAQDMPAVEETQVIIAGFGRFGQIVARLLRAKKIGFTALETSPEQVAFAKKFGSKIYYGDPSRIDLLKAARADQASAFVLAIDDVEASLRTARTVVKHFPHLTIYARARDRRHVHRLMDLGVTVIQREAFLSSLDIARHLLIGLGLPDYEAQRVVDTFKAHDEERLFNDWGQHDDEEKMIKLAKKAAEELEELLAADVETGSK